MAGRAWPSPPPPPDSSSTPADPQEPDFPVAPRPKVRLPKPLAKPMEKPTEMSEAEHCGAKPKYPGLGEGVFLRK